ncbi:mitochondrial dynamics protein MID49 isoform X1 [Prionailurus bengalensis]|uniref:mitochondrial dynamics protein MID49 isoform X1 n=2 Tax=Prionailurus bengalensis TaxID=37029 RepID=UPI001CA983FC|nr:mitochondrial dynamics protein MID49 isoform X1 [Prionailurus bengalensis]XP_043439228.1 mitochondrial dynamics protein MID49 isoform X1 [Prionailurus bengalensis]
MGELFAGLGEEGLGSSPSPPKKPFLLRSSQDRLSWALLSATPAGWGLSHCQPGRPHLAIPAPCSFTGRQTMAEFSQKRGRQRDEVLGSTVDFLLANARLVLGVGGAAVLGIATLAVKRLIDRATSPRDEDDAKGDTTCLEESWKELTLLKTTPRLQPRTPPAALSQPASLPAPLPSAPEGPSDTEPQPLPQPSSPAPLCLTFQEKLLAFERDHVTIPEAHVALAKQLAGDIALELQAYLRNKFPELPFGALVPGGPLYDGLQGGAANRVRLLVPLVLEVGLWGLVPGVDTVARDPRCWAVRRTQLEFRPRGSSPWDRFLVGGYLSSRVLLELLRKALASSVNWPAIGGLLGCLIRPSVASEELLLDVQHERLELTVAVLLAVTGADAEDRLLLAWPLEGLAGNLWLQDLYPAEAARLRALDERDAGTRRRLLRLLCGVCRGHPALGRLDRCHLTQVVLRLGEEEVDWAEAALGERFLQALESLIDSLERASLPCRFNPGVNLLSGLREEEIDDIGFALYSGLQAPECLL